eukprot:sb/3465742/
MALWTFYRVTKHISWSNSKFKTQLPTADPTISRGTERDCRTCGKGRASGDNSSVELDVTIIELTDTCKQPIRTRYLGHVTGYQPIRDQYPARIVSICVGLIPSQLELAGKSCDNLAANELTDTCKQPIRTHYLGHVTGYQPIRDQYPARIISICVGIIPFQLELAGKSCDNLAANEILLHVLPQGLKGGRDWAGNPTSSSTKSRPIFLVIVGTQDYYGTTRILHILKSIVFTQCLRSEYRVNAELMQISECRANAERMQMNDVHRIVSTERLSSTVDRELTDTCKQPIRTHYLGHVTGYQPIRDQYPARIISICVGIIPFQLELAGKSCDNLAANEILLHVLPQGLKGGRDWAGNPTSSSTKSRPIFLVIVGTQ